MTEHKKYVASSTTEWDTIKKEYCTSKISMHNLAKKYGVAVSTISRRAKLEQWNRITEQIEKEAEQKLIASVAETRASNADKAQRILDKLMDKLDASIEVVKDGDVQSLKQLVSAMKDLKDMAVYDINTNDKEITVTFASKEGADYAD